MEQEHDIGYKRLLSKKRNFLHFLKKYINADWVKKIDEKDITPINTTLIDAKYRKTMARRTGMCAAASRSICRGTRSSGSIS